MLKETNIAIQGDPTHTYESIQIMELHSNIMKKLLSSTNCGTSSNIELLAWGLVHEALEFHSHVVDNLTLS